MATYPLATLCDFSTTPGEATTVYNFSCNNPCSYWVFYILDFPEPLSGSCKNTLPCKVDTASLSEQAKVTRSELQVATYGKDRMGNTLATSINVTRGTLMMVVQCVSSTTYIDGMMVRVGKSPITLHYSEGYNTITVPLPTTVPQNPTPIPLLSPSTAMPLRPSTTTRDQEQYTIAFYSTTSATKQSFSVTPTPLVVVNPNTGSNMTE